MFECRCMNLNLLIPSLYEDGRTVSGVRSVTASNGPNDYGGSGSLEDVNRRTPDTEGT